MGLDQGATVTQCHRAAGWGFSSTSIRAANSANCWDAIAARNGSFPPHPTGRESKV